ncbi:MAG TPA: hypothetical protein VGC13_23325 [Longimicrobium sp.]|jgi:hypothetical protein|uniref:hypothetical protein n=1 Tax=Longimicrobium sp. TaxID=2029185 RepID=UPI002ED832B9
MLGLIYRLLLLVFAAVLLSAVPAAAQADTVPEAPRGGGLEMIGGVRVGWPQKLSGYVGVGVPRKRFESGYTGWSLIVEPGLGGGAVRVGRTTHGGLGMTARGQFSVLRTWGDPWLVGPDRTWVGFDAQANVGYVGFAVGGYVRVPTGEFDPAPMLTLNLAFGN